MIQELGSDLVPIFAIGCGSAAFIIWIIAATVDSMYKTSRNTGLKERMLEQGYSPTEIARVFGAKNMPFEEDPEVTPVPPVKHHNGQHARHLAR